MTAANENDRSTADASRPAELTWDDWKQILLRVKDQIAKDNVSLISAGVAFYAMLALFPGIAAFVGIYGVFADPTDVADHLGTLAAVMPAEAFNIVREQVTDLTSAGPTELGFASVLAILLALWSTRAGVNALVMGLNIVYDQRERRGFFSQISVTLTLTAVLLVVLAIAFLAILAVPVVLDTFYLGDVGEWLAAILRWPIVIATVIVGLALMYRFGPHRSEARLVWLSWGAAAATVLWIVGSAAFSIYVANFSNYNETYGSLGAVVGLLMWFYLSAFIVLLGAEINSEMERQTHRDTTTGPPRPMGERGAVVADHPPEARR
ncbi:YihY/virulence factor BrkB family protein [Minwuia sp.]|uniref:YihY/virulence factor BrkB family protein n=1 Tax=Minwuia sp. TaxID=2493630 RepID=UPI003A8EF8EA